MAKPGLPHLLWSFWIRYYGTYYSSLYIAWFEESVFQAFLKSCPSNSLFYEAIFTLIASRQDKLSPEYLKNTFSTYFQGVCIYIYIYIYIYICFIDCLYVINNIYKYMFMKICVLLLREFSKWKSFLKWREYIYIYICICIYTYTHTHINL